MSYESLEREMERRKLRRTKGDKKIERKSFPNHRGRRKGSKDRTKQSESVENWSGDEEGQLSKALAAARERANIVKPLLNIKKLPHRNQRSLTDFEANTRWTSSYPGELPPWCSNRNPRAIVQYPCDCGECDTQSFNSEEDDYDEDDYGLCSQGCPNDEVTELCEECYQCRDNCCVFWDCFKCKGPVCVNERFFEENLQTMKNIGIISGGQGESTSVCTECLEDVMNQISEEVEVSDPPTQEEALRILASGVIWRPEDVAELASDALNQTENDYKWVKYLKRFGAEESFQAESFRAEPAMYVKCFECERPGYSDEMKSVAFGYLCSRCSNPKIDWVNRRAENISLRPNELKILQYLSQFSPDGVNRWDPPVELTQSSIAKLGMGITRTAVLVPLNRLLELGLITMRQKRPIGQKRVQKVYFPTYEGLELAKNTPIQKMAETSMDIDGDGQVELWEVQAHENNLTGLGHEETFNASSTKDKQIEIRKLAIEVITTVKTWLWLQDLTGRINDKLPPRKKVSSQFVSRVVGNSRGGTNGFYITMDGKIYYHGDVDRGEFIKGVF